MRGKTRYTHEPMQVGRVLRGLLPPPESLVPKEDAVKVTISLSARSIQFFKAEAAKGGVQYQRMIRRVLDAYVEAFEPGRGPSGGHGAGPRVVEEAHARYRATPRKPKRGSARTPPRR